MVNDKINVLSQKIIDIYCIFQQAFHDNFVKYCEIIDSEKKIYEPGTCNCITTVCANNIAGECYNKVFGTNDYHCVADCTCSPQFSCWNINQLAKYAVNKLDDIMEELKKELEKKVLKDEDICYAEDIIKRNILIIICFAALTGNCGIMNSKSRTNIYKAFDLLFLSDAKLSERLQILTMSHESSVEKTIDKLDTDSDSKKVLKCIFECCKRIQSTINVGGSSNQNVARIYEFNGNLFLPFTPLTRSDPDSLGGKIFA